MQSRLHPEWNSYADAFGVPRVHHQCLTTSLLCLWYVYFPLNLPHCGKSLIQCTFQSERWDNAVLSNEEIADKFEKGYIIDSGSITLRSVVRIGPDAVVKLGHLDISEINTMELVRAHTSIPVPRVYRYFANPKFEEATCMVMEYIDGQPLDKCWNKLSIWRRAYIIWTIRGYVQQLRRIPHPNPGVPGRLGPKPTECVGIMFGELVSTWRKGRGVLTVTVLRCWTVYLVQRTDIISEQKIRNCQTPQASPSARVYATIRQHISFGIYPF